MLTREKVIEILRNELPYLSSNYDVKRIGLFGSFSKERPGEDSDIDLLVEFEKPIGLKFMELAEYIENLFSRKVEILTNEGIRGIRIKQIAEDIMRSMVYV